MKVLVTGASGQLGSDVVKYLLDHGHQVIAPSREEMDIVSVSRVSGYFQENTPSAVIHCAAWTAVDAAEDNEELCRLVNADGTRNIVESCRALDIPLVYISTDYVFDGSGDRPRKVNEPTNPINIYGKSKEEGERIVEKYPKHFIVRISWVFGNNGKNFIKTMLNLSKKTETVKVVDDQFGSPTYTVDLAPLLTEMILSKKYGTYHAHNEGYCSWYDVAVKVFEIADIKERVIPIKSEEYPMKARRPFNSRLDTSSLTENGFVKLPPWEDAVKRFVKTLL